MTDDLHASGRWPLRHYVGGTTPGERHGGSGACRISGHSAERDITDIIGGWEVEADLNQLAVSGRRYGQLAITFYRGCVQVPKRRLEVAVFGAIRVDVLEGCGDWVNAVAEPFEVRTLMGTSCACNVPVS